MRHGGGRAIGGGSSALKIIMEVVNMNEAVNTNQEDEGYKVVEDAIKYGFYMGYSFALRESVARFNELIVNAEATMMEIKEGNKYLQGLEVEGIKEEHDNSKI